MHKWCGDLDECAVDTEFTLADNARLIHRRGDIREVVVGGAVVSAR